ncbi:MAG TPA: cation:proton antiporter, partial [Acidimicrobiales bacterium]|nr:cation:proton antiporter [Acidimicrobiales bacterium]
RIFTLAIFGVTVAVVGLVVSGVFRSAAPKISLERFRRRTWQLDIRFAILILVAFAALADELGFDGILGAFAAGVLIRIADREGIVRNRSFMDRVDAVGFGLLIPVFFITSGFDLDFRALFHSPDHLALVPIFFVGFLASRALPPLLLWRDLERRRTVAMGLLSATTLTVVVVAVDAALSLRILDSAAATALVSAALLTQVVCPPIALALMGEAPATASGVADNLD